MKKIIIVAILTAGLLLPSLAFCTGARSMPRDGWWRRPSVAQAINLTDEEKAKLEAAYIQSQRTRLDLKAAAEKEQFELEVLLESASDKEVMAQYAKMNETRDRLGEEMFRFILETRQIIGKERFKQIKDMAKQWRKDARTRSYRNQQWGNDPRLSQPNSAKPGAQQAAPSAAQ
ncbi:Spy/CpxP family protein refolding chaperone [Desulfatibacillum aliphaticivorans]|uniref:Spy/CpxP family protein refolding chaperone n=1 Tax=Desulfatibacillum aliphaticivorans TaxID=218208 RepID=UPI000405F8AE|nr:hypothetical protein [Desulfatibacillum aliphaticivorans]